MPTDADMTTAMAAAARAGMSGEVELTPAQFQRIADWLYRHAGIRMRVGKEGLVRARLARRLRLLGLTDYDAYIAFVEGEVDGREFNDMVDALTTNKTSFLREHAHFDYLRSHVLPQLSGPVRIWSAGCSSGEEAYTLAMLMNDAVPDVDTRDIRILATDLSQRVLNTAKTGRYAADGLSMVPAPWLQRYWTSQTVAEKLEYEAGPALRRLIHFAKLNLMEKWPMQGPFDAIFCRNVMIYFDKETQQRLIERFHALLKPGGTLCVGHSESLTGLTHRFRYVQPAVYTK